MNIIQGNHAGRALEQTVRREFRFLHSFCRPPQSSPWRPSRIYGYRWGCRKWSRFTALQKWWRPTAAIPTDFVTEEKEEEEEEEEKRPTGNRSHFSQLRPRDSRQGSLQTGEICNTIALSNTIFCMLSEGAGTSTFILLQLVSYTVESKLPNHFRSQIRICMGNLIPLGQPQRQQQIILGTNERGNSRQTDKPALSARRSRNGTWRIRHSFSMFHPFICRCRQL